MRKLIISGLFAAALAGIAFAADRDRHADYTNPKAPAGQTQSQCKGFYGGDDNLTACADWCGQYRTDNQGATCECGEGKCVADDH
jgi:hypothetical protein